MASAWLPPVPPWSAIDKSSFAFQSVAKRWPTIITSAIDALYQASHALSYSSEQIVAKDKVKEAKTIIERLSKVKHDMGRDRPLEIIGEDGGNSTAEYDEIVRAKNWTWFTAPWLFAECYLYQLLRSFFERSNHWKHYDPFSIQKVKAFKSSATAIDQLSETIEKLILEVESKRSNLDLQEAEIIFKELVQTSLWGNATDLSLLTHLTHGDIQALQAGGVGAEAQRNRQHYILSGLAGIDKAWHCLRQAGKDSCIDIILDNSGFELFTDLLLADFVLATGLVRRVRFHPKKIPWFVSDVTPSDFLFTIEALHSRHFFEKISEDGQKEEYNSSSGEENNAKSQLDNSYFIDAQIRSVSPSRSFVIDSSSVLHHLEKQVRDQKPNARQRLASRWSRNVQNGAFELSMPIDTPLGGQSSFERTGQSNFWTSYHNYPSLPLAAPILFDQLKQSALIISKGDLNYRKWCSDARWSFSEPFENVLGPVRGEINLLVLRTNKSDVCVGVPPERLETLNDEDPEWRVNGKFAMVEFTFKK